MAESFENYDNILLDWPKDKVQKNSCRGIEQVKEARKQNLILVSREPLLYLKFNNPYKQNVSEINLFKKFNFSQCQNNC